MARVSWCEKFLATYSIAHAQLSIFRHIEHHKYVEHATVRSELGLLACRLRDVKGMVLQGGQAEGAWQTLTVRGRVFEL